MNYQRMMCRFPSVLFCSNRWAIADEWHQAFAASELLELVKDRTRLVKITNALNQHWQKRNPVKKMRPTNGSQNEHVAASSNI